MCYKLYASTNTIISSISFFCFRFSLKISTVDGLTVYLPAKIGLFLEDLRQSRFLSCNFKRAREFYSTYGDDESTEARTFRKRGKQVLQLAKVNLDKLGVRFWLSSGTCLGKYLKCPWDEKIWRSSFTLCETQFKNEP